jgi:hypothetical protein
LVGFLIPTLGEFRAFGHPGGLIVPLPREAKGEEDDDEGDNGGEVLHDEVEGVRGFGNWGLRLRSVEVDLQSADSDGRGIRGLAEDQNPVEFLVIGETGDGRTGDEKNPFEEGFHFPIEFLVKIPGFRKEKGYGGVGKPAGESEIVPEGRRGRGGIGHD